MESPASLAQTTAADRGSHRAALRTLANQLTLSRLALAVVFFAMLSVGRWRWLNLDGMHWALIVFIVATTTDALDGYLARLWQQVTTLGRILDPFVDKIIICGAFIVLLPFAGSGLSAWMVTLIVARELFVTALRSFLEQHGADFSATWSGKIKMIVQCVAVGWILLYLGLSPASSPSWFPVVRDLLLAATLLITVFSGLVYLRRALTLLR